jgi:hypothetical protein
MAVVASADTGNSVTLLYMNNRIDTFKFGQADTQINVRELNITSHVGTFGGAVDVRS